LSASFVQKNWKSFFLALERRNRNSFAEGEKTRSDKADEENLQLRKDLEDIQTSQTLLIDKLITCCKEQPNAERTQRLFASLREELEKRGSKLADEPVGG